MKAGAGEIFYAALEGVSPSKAVSKHLSVTSGGVLRSGGRRYDLNRYNNIYVIGAGKASCRMAKAVEIALGSRLTGGIVVTKYGHSIPLERIETVEAAHPIPDRNGLKASREVLKAAERAGAGDLVICLVSGGASALLPSTLKPIRLSDIQRLTKRLINSGADIHEINTVRKHLSKIKGGGLLKRILPAECLTLIISDVIGDDPSTIASGPTVPDLTTFADAYGVLRRYGLLTDLPASILKVIKGGMRGSIEETLKPGPLGERANNVIIANNRTALSAAAMSARALGYRPVILTATVSGDTREAAGFFSSVVKEVRAAGNPASPPACILMGGETTVEVRGRGTGGRNAEFALVCALELAGVRGALVLAAGTDGTDGPTDAAGAFADGSTVERARRAGADPKLFLKQNDSYSLFKTIGDLFITGPTGTNVMDVALALVE